jgi:hypothetical protein
MIDYGMAQRAGRRQGRAFGVTMPTGGRRVAARRRKLTPADVVDIRTWAARQGFGLARKRQALALATRFPVSPATIVDVLENESWVDVGYTPGAPDVAWLRALPTVAAVLVVLAR